MIYGNADREKSSLKWTKSQKSKTEKKNFEGKRRRLKPSNLDYFGYAHVENMSTTVKSIGEWRSENFFSNRKSPKTVKCDVLDVNRSTLSLTLVSPSRENRRKVNHNRTTQLQAVQVHDRDNAASSHVTSTNTHNRWPPKSFFSPSLAHFAFLSRSRSLFSVFQVRNINSIAENLWRMLNGARCIKI